MRRVGLCCLIAWGLTGPVAHAQVIFPGSTPQGDYLRGLGIAASGFGDLYMGMGIGMGQYNLLTAQAESINADTAIKVDTYVNMVLRQGRDNYQLINRLEQEKLKANYEAIRRRIRENPNEVDLMSGSTLNVLLEQLNDPLVHPSSYRAFKVDLPVEKVRKIPFKLDEKGLRFSFQRLTPKGRSKWPVALQDPRYDGGRKAFERAVDTALEQMIEGRMTASALQDYSDAVRILERELDEQFGASREPHYNEAKRRLDEMANVAKILKTHKMQSVLAELDHYSGTTLDDLRLFMQAHNLRFGVPDTDEERRMYPELHAGLSEMRDRVKDQGREFEK
ncbi:hypothetical protein P12x_004954 [Tundrisphaera lichenicola]|uniref:hypothetical protein n=1 Tax=Tundrisphaera lichenicola TaxID=2029860 RepID=UPI003EB886C4